MTTNEKEDPRLLKLRRQHKESMYQRRKHRKSARIALQNYNDNPRIITKLLLMVAQERSRGSKTRARKIHEGYLDMLEIERETTRIPPLIQNEAGLRELAITDPDLLVEYAHHEGYSLGFRACAVDAFTHMKNDSRATDECIRIFQTGDMILQEAALGALSYLGTSKAVAFLHKVVREDKEDELIVEIATELTEDVPLFWETRDVHPRTSRS